MLRGSICDRNGEELAVTRLAEDGSEYRSYPYGPLFAQVVGYSVNGKSGLEARYSYPLYTSHEGLEDLIRHEVKGSRMQGDRLITTLDASLTQVAWEALGDYKGAVIVLEQESGNVLCCISKPSFDPNTVAENWDYLNSGEAGSVFLNRGLQGLYPPGSTFKIVTSLAALRQGQTPDGITYTCEGAASSGDYTMHCAGGGVHGTLTLPTAFAVSCNTYFASLGLGLDWEGVRETADSLYLNADLVLELPSKASVFSANQDSPDALKMQTAIGQGETLVTPMEMACICAAAANHGILMKPRFADHLENASGRTVKEYPVEELGRVMEEKECRILTSLMRGVVEYGSASLLANDRVTICGKTGSAEHGDGSEETHSWFVGFGESEGRDITVCVLAESAGSGASVAVPVANQLFCAYYS